MNETLAFSGNVVFPDGVRKATVSFADGVITSIEENKEGAIALPEKLYLAPGFIDEHIHGANGTDFMDAKISSIGHTVHALPREGVTSLLATTMTMDAHHIENALQAIDFWMKDQHRGARILGAHLEGPFISPKHVGAQDPRNVLTPDVATFQAFQKASGGHIKEVTFAYEEDKDGSFLKELVKEGVLPSIGHSDCTAEVLKKGIAGGIRCVTHVFNAQRGFHHREPGIVGEALINDGLKTELICDFIHSVPDAVKLLFHSKKKGDIVLISDSTEGKYLAPGKYQLGGQDILISDVARLEDGTIAGSILCLDQALRNARTVAEGYSMSDLINCVSLNPATNLGVQDKVGSIAPGKYADFALIDKDFHVYMTFVGGKLMYQKEKFSL